MRTFLLTPHDGPELPGDDAAAAVADCCDVVGTDRAMGLCPNRLSDNIECDVWYCRTLDILFSDDTS